MRLLRGTLASLNAEPTVQLPSLTAAETVRGLATLSYTVTGSKVKQIGESGAADPVVGALVRTRSSLSSFTDSVAANETVANARSKLMSFSESVRSGAAENSGGALAGARSKFASFSSSFSQRLSESSQVMRPSPPPNTPASASQSFRCAGQPASFEDLSGQVEKSVPEASVEVSATSAEYLVESTPLDDESVIAPPA